MRSAIVGAFVLGGLLLFAGGLFLIGDRRMLFSRQFELYTTFGKVTGLQVGTTVRVAGLDAGEVLEIALPSKPSEKFRVHMRLREDVRPLVRTDSAAAVQTDGIVGSAFIQVGVGTDTARAVSPGDTITGIDPIEFADLIQEGRETFRTVSREIIDVKEDVSMALAALTETVEAANGIIAATGEDLRTLAATSAKIAEEVHGTMADTRAVVADVKAGRGTIGQLLTDRALYDRLTNAAGAAEQTVHNLRETTERARAALETVAAPGGTAEQLTQTLRSTLLDVQEITSDLAEGTEALKYNFLFRGFFDERGFYDLDSIGRESYLSGALEGNDRTALRIWLRADVLFERGPDGAERLTAGGRRRLDSAMSDFVRYPRNSPLVVEGYAGGADMPYLLSDVRAQLVRDYLMSRFRRQTTLTGAMALSDQAPGSPSGDGRWSGVALALFVRNDTLDRGGR